MLAKLASLSAEESRAASSRGRRARCPGAAYAASLDGVACRVFMWRTANRARWRRRRRTAPRSTSTPTARRGARAPARVRGGDGAGLRAPLRRPGAPGATARSGSRWRRTCRRPYDRRADRRRRARRRRRLRRRLRVVGVEPESAATLTAALAAGSRRIEPRRSPTAQRAVHGRAHAQRRPRARGRDRARLRGRSPRGCASLRPREARLRAGWAAATGALLAGKVEVEPGSIVVAVVSGGNADPKVAAAILAEA